MSKQIISTPLAPAAVGPYSQAVGAGGLVFVSGQIALDPDTGSLVSKDIREQTRQAIKNLQAVLAAASMDLTQVVKTTLYLTDMDDFAAVNAVYSEFFSAQPPARACIQVGALPKGADVEIEAVASASA